jgi:tetratricopeptide (TPR) repeat protein
VYAAEQLERMGEQEEIRRHHALYFLALAEESEPHLGLPEWMDSEQAIWLSRLETEHENLRAALGWGLRDEEKATQPQGQPISTLFLSPEEVGLRMTGALRWFWEVHGHLSEGRAFLAAALGRAEGAGLMPSRARALGAAGRLALIQGDYLAARELLEQSLAIFRELGDKSNFGRSLVNLGLVLKEQGDYRAARELFEEGLAISRELGSQYGIAWSLHYLGRMADEQGDFGAARSLHEQSLAIFRESGYRLGIALTLHYLGLAVSHQGDYETAKRRYEESLVIFQELGDKANIALSLSNLGNVAKDQGDYGTALTLHEESLTIQRELGDVLATACSLEDFAGLAVRQGQYERAVRLLGAVEALAATLGRTSPSGDSSEVERTVAIAQAALSEERFAAAWEEGRAMTLEQAVAYALAWKGVDLLE